MKKIEKLSAKALTELMRIVRDRKSLPIEIRRAQSILLINENCSELTLKTVTGLGLFALLSVRGDYALPTKNVNFMR